MWSTQSAIKKKILVIHLYYHYYCFLKNVGLNGVALLAKRLDTSVVVDGVSLNFNLKASSKVSLNKQYWRRLNYHSDRKPGILQRPTAHSYKHLWIHAYDTSSKSAGQKKFPTKTFGEKDKTKANQSKDCPQEAGMGQPHLKAPRQFSKESLDWHPQGKRRVKRPGKTWRR